MNKIVCRIFFILLLSACSTQKQLKMTKDDIDITKDVSVDKFQTIATAILRDGDRRFYCNRYNYSPHYKIDTNIDLYLDPIDQSINMTPDKNSSDVADYNTIVISDHNGRTYTTYYRVILQDGSVLLKFDDERDNRALAREKFQKQYLPLIENTFNLK